MVRRFTLCTPSTICTAPRGLDPGTELVSRSSRLLCMHAGAARGTYDVDECIDPPGSHFCGIEGDDFAAVDFPCPMEHASPANPLLPRWVHAGPAAPVPGHPAACHVGKAEHTLSPAPLAGPGQARLPQVPKVTLHTPQ
jgi:hypothetical protein